MKNISKIVSISLGTVLMLGAPQTYATNGYFTHGSGTKNKGMAGAGIAMPEEAMAISNNPASALLLEDSLQAGAALFNPKRNYTTGVSANNGANGTFTIGPNSLDSAREWFVIPHIAKTWQLSDDSAWGVAFYGRGGMNTRWEGGTATFDPDGPGPAPIAPYDGTFGAGAFGISGRTGVDLSQAFLDLTYARRLSDVFIGGIGVVVVTQMFEAEGLQAFTGFTQTFNDTLAATGDPDQAFASVTSLSGNGHDTSFGAGLKVGINAAFTPQLSLAARYTTEIGMGEFDDYSDLFAGGGNFDIPANAKLGLTFKATDSLSYSVDIEQTWFSKVDSVGNAFANIFTCPTVNPLSTTTDGCLGGANGAGFGWDDMTIYKLGAQWRSSDQWTWRAGYSHGSQPIPETELLFNILAPAVIEDHLTFGFTKTHLADNEINFAFMYALNNSVQGINPFDFTPASPLNPPQTIEIEMDQIELELSYSWKF